MKHIKIFIVLLLIGFGWCSKVNSMEAKDNVIAFSSNDSGDIEIYLTDPTGKSKVQITHPPLSGGGYLAWSPNGQHIAFYKKYDDGKTWSIHTINKDGTNWQRLTQKQNVWDSSPAWSPDGNKIAFARTYRDHNDIVQNEIWSMNADGSKKTQIKPLSGGAPYFTADGKIVFHAQFNDKKSEISIANADGSNLIQLTQTEAEEWQPEVSPDGNEIAFISKREGNFEIYIMDIDGSNQTRLTNNAYYDSMPTWSPDGSQIIFTSNRGETWDMYIMNKDGSGEKKIVVNGYQPAWYKPIQ
ncbi:DUF5050 domain-containing protein [Alteromonas facilis]|uniref:DUF5050 domain-containing protein n=1 Tax=Alteromonas facilis TaxID=2048004 RepID=UPI000F5CC947|nr:DUF5050 domain-containing protein [Alteromonas facilis]